MTAKLMIPFMAAFRDEYVGVRKEVCIAAGNLGITDEPLIAELLRLANRDPIWRIKALAIQGIKTDSSMFHGPWSMFKIYSCSISCSIR